MRSRRIIAAVSSLALLTACSDDDTAADVTSNDLDGRTFVADEVEGQTLVAGTEITLTFTDEAVTAVAGCNTMNGGFTVDDGVLDVETLAQTLMACPDELQAQDEWLVEFLGAEPTVGLSDEMLTLTAGDVTITATELT